MTTMPHSARTPRPIFLRSPAGFLLSTHLLLLGASGLAATTPPREERIQRYVQFCTAVREQVIDGGTCPHNPTQVATLLATDPAGLSSWVREKIAYEPTFGSNRGAEGTLAAMAGGDWDRALLLGEMLRAGGYSPYYLAIPRTPAEIAAVESAWLISECHWQKLTADTPPAEGAPRPAAELLTEHGIDPSSVLNHQIRAAQLWKTLLNESGTPVEAVATRIESAIASLGSPGTKSAAAASTRFRQAMQTRVLIEIDLDGTPLVLSAGPDEALPAASVIAGQARLDNIPEDQLTLLSLTVAMEPNAQNGAAEPIVLFTWSKELGALGLQAARLEIVPVNIEYDDPAFTWAPAIWRERLSRLEQFQVVLRHGEEPLAGPVFTRDGTLLGSGGGKEDDAGKLGQGVGGLFGGAFGGDEEEPAPATATPAASAALAPMSPSTPATVHPLCLILELREPGQPPMRQKRLLTGELRPGKLPIYTADILACGGALGPLSVAWQALDVTTANASTLGEVLSSTDPERLEGHDDLKRFPSLLHDWQLGRLALGARQLRDRPELTLQSGPTVVLVSNQLCPDEQSEGITTRVALDVAFDGLTLVPRTENSFPAAYAANVRLGIASTLLETALLRRCLPPPVPQGTFDFWRLAEKAGKAPIAILVSADGGLGKARPHPLAAWGIQGGEAGKLLVFPGGSDPRVWWSINPLDGRTIGRGDCAEGMSMIEYLQVIKLNLSNLKCNLAMMHSLMGGAGEDAGKDWLMCMTGADNPGSYVSWAGSAMDVYKVTQWGGILAQVGDCLAGAWDVHGMIKGK